MPRWRHGKLQRVGGGEKVPVCGIRACLANTLQFTRRNFAGKLPFTDAVNTTKHFTELGSVTRL